MTKKQTTKTDAKKTAAAKKAAPAKNTVAATREEPPGTEEMPLQIPDWMDFHADVTPDALAVASPRLRLSFGQLRAASVAAALKLRESGVARGQIAAIHVTAPALRLVLLLALHRLGVTICVMPTEPVRRHTGLKALTLDWLLTDEDEKLSAAKVVLLDLEWLTRLQLTDARMPGGFSKPGDISVITMSSGTTTAPRPIAYSVAQMEKRVVWRSLGDQGTPCGEKSVILASLGSMNGMQSTLGALWGGGAVYLGWTPETAPRVIASDRVERLFCSAPLLFQIMAALDEKPLDVSCLKQIYAGGDALPPGLSRRVMEKMCPNLLTGFSTNEAGRLALGLVAQMVRPELVGYLMPWAEAQAVDDEGKVLPPGQEGYLRFKSPMMVQDYHGDGAGAADRFADGWFSSDDIGWIRRDRMLVISGRRRDFVATAAGRFNPARLDHAFSGHPKIIEAAGFGMKNHNGPDEIWLAVVEREPIPDEELWAFCNSNFGKFSPRKIMRLGQLPRTESGKVVRRRLEELALANLPPRPE